MKRTDIVRLWLTERVGNPYIMGATGAKCTPNYREARANQYPGSAANIRKYCPVLSGKASNCKKCDYNGKQAYDCAQLVRFAMKQAGIEMVSGATSQWNKTNWANEGTIATMPKDKMCLLYRYDGNNVFGHTGIYLGDGTFQHAKGHKDGVKVEKMEDGNWTHWAIPVGLYDDTDEDAYVVTGNNLALRKKPSLDAAVLERIPNGTICWGTAENSAWVKTSYKGKNGYSMVDFLKKLGNEADDNAEADLEPVEDAEEVALKLPKELAKALLAALKTAIEGGE